MKIAEITDSHKYRQHLQRGYNMLKLDYNSFDIKIKYSTFKRINFLNRQFSNISFLDVFYRNFSTMVFLLINPTTKKGFQSIEHQKTVIFRTIDIAAGVGKEKVLGGKQFEC